MRRRCPGICSGSRSAVKATYLARDGEIGVAAGGLRELRLGPSPSHQPEQAPAHAGARRGEEDGVAHELAPPHVQRLRRDLGDGRDIADLRHVRAASQRRTAIRNASASSMKGYCPTRSNYTHYE